MAPKKKNPRNGKKDTKRSREKEINIIEGALRVFGEYGFEKTTISAISKAAGISDATLYEYFSSKEDVLFTIPLVYTRREYERLQAIAPYVHGARARMRMVIQAYLDFFENNRLYTSVVLLTLKGNRGFLSSEAYQEVRKSAHTIVDVYKEGVAEGVFRDDLDPFLVRNMVLGFIEHLTIQWLLVGRPESISDMRETIFGMVIRAIENRAEPAPRQLRVTIEELTAPGYGTEVDPKTPPTGNQTP